MYLLPPRYLEIIFGSTFTSSCVHKTRKGTIVRRFKLNQYHQWLQLDYLKPRTLVFNTKILWQHNSLNKNEEKPKSFRHQDQRVGLSFIVCFPPCSIEFVHNLVSRELISCFFETYFQDFTSGNQTFGWNFLLFFFFFSNTFVLLHFQLYMFLEINYIDTYS